MLMHRDGHSVRFLEEGVDEGGKYLRIEHAWPRPGPMAGPHWHPVLAETFAVREGRMRFRVDRREFVLGPGETVTVRPRELHRFWNEGEGRLVVVHEVRPPLRHRAMFELWHRLDLEGKTNRRGVPTNPLALGLLWERQDGYVSGLPASVQTLVFGGLARLARLVGYEDRWADEPDEHVLRDVELSAGIVEYEDTGGDGPVVVLLHGLVQNGSLWRHVVRDLKADHRCVVPTLPLGGHRWPMCPNADLSMRGLSRLVVEFLERLDLRAVTLVENDWGGAHLLVSERGGERVARLVITSCEAFENYPPGLPGRAVWLAAKVPGGLNAMVQPLRLRPLRRLPIAFGWMSKRPVPNEVMDGWLRPALSQRGIRRDLRKYLRAVDKRDTLEAAERLRSFEHPALVAWAAEDRVMPPEHGRRLVDLLPQGRLIEIDDSYTLIPEDRPGELARAIRRFVRDAT